MYDEFPLGILAKTHPKLYTRSHILKLLMHSPEKASWMIKSLIHPHVSDFLSISMFFPYFCEDSAIQFSISRKNCVHVHLQLGSVQNLLRRHCIILVGWEESVQWFNIIPIIPYMGVSKNRGTPKSSILIGFSIINHPFLSILIFGNIHI